VSRKQQNRGLILILKESRAAFLGLPVTAEHFGNFIFLFCLRLPNILATLLLTVFQKISAEFCFKT